MDELSDNPCAGVVRFRFGGYDLSSHRQWPPLSVMQNYIVLAS